MSIAPCQSLFVAPCSHVWHYKCIRPILNGHTWPNFLCPNCRAVADLEADVDDVPADVGVWVDEDERGVEEAIAASRNESMSGPGAEEGGQNGDGEDGRGGEDVDGVVSASVRLHSRLLREQQQQRSDADDEATDSAPHAAVPSVQRSRTSFSVEDSTDDSHHLVAATHALSLNDSTPSLTTDDNRPSTSSLSTPRPIPGSRPGTARSQSSPGDTTQYALSPGVGGVVPGGEGPMTPRNDAGPFVLDGGAGQPQGGSLGPVQGEQGRGRRAGGSSGVSMEDHA
jgi:hypothetical protein